MGRSLRYSIIALLFLATLIGCSSPKGDSASNTTNAASAGSTLPVVQAKVVLSVSDGNGVVFSEAAPAGSPQSSLQLKSGQSYMLNLDVTNAPAGATYSLQLQRTDLIKPPAAISFALNAGSNSFSVPDAGNYSGKLVVSASGFSAETKNYAAIVTCATPTFSANSMKGVSINVSAGSGDNLYNYSASFGSLDGVGPYYCAWDVTGAGIVDTGFDLCVGPGAANPYKLNDGYSNLVLQRNIHLLVKDSCNIVQTASSSQNLAYPKQTPGAGNVFIDGQVSNASGAAKNNASVDGAFYFADNLNPQRIVTSQYGNGSFQIKSSMNYHMGSSVDFGMELDISGIIETTKIDVSKQQGAVDVSKANINNVTFITDQAGDQAPSLTFSGSNCTWTNRGAKVLFVSGKPCAAGTSGDNNVVTVEVWGHYSCMGLSAPTGSMDIGGDFDGYYDLADSCSGGGGGGGGQPPPKF